MKAYIAACVANMAINVVTLEFFSRLELGAAGSAEQIEADAVAAAEGIRKGADEYAFEVLCQLEQELARSLSVIANGLRTLQDRRDGVETEATAPETDAVTELSEKPEQ